MLKPAHFCACFNSGCRQIQIFLHNQFVVFFFPCFYYNCFKFCERLMCVQLIKIYNNIISKVKLLRFTFLELMNIFFGEKPIFFCFYFDKKMTNNLIVIWCYKLCRFYSTNYWMVDSSENNTCHHWGPNWPLTMFSEIKSLLFHAWHQPRCPHRFSGRKFKFFASLLNRWETAPMLTSLLLECRMVCTFLQEIIDERITIRRKVWSSLAGVLQDFSRRLWLNKIPAVLCLTKTLCRVNLEHFNFL